MPFEDWQKENTTTIDPYDTKLGINEESVFQQWKSKYAPNDTGEDYDLRGAYKAGLKPDPNTGHWPDTFKKPNHPTFSNQSQYAVGENAKLAGRWEGDRYIKPTGFSDWQIENQSPSIDPNYQRNLEAAHRANDMSVKYNIPWDHAERIAQSLVKKPETDPMGTIGPAPPKAKSWFIPSDEQMVSDGYDHKGRYIFDEYIARPLFGYTKGVAMSSFEPIWKLFQKYKGDDMPEEWKGKSLDSAIGTSSTEDTPFAADAVHGLADFIGSYKTAKTLLPEGQGLLTDKPGWLLEGQRFLTATGMPEVAKVIAQEENAHDAIKTTVLQTLGGAAFGKLATIEAAESAKLMSQSLVLYAQARIGGEDPDKAAAMAAVPFVFKATDMLKTSEPEKAPDVPDVTVPPNEPAADTEPAKGSEKPKDNPSRIGEAVRLSLIHI